MKNRRLYPGLKKETIKATELFDRIAAKANKLNTTEMETITVRAKKRIVDKYFLRAVAEGLVKPDPPIKIEAVKKHINLKAMQVVISKNKQRNGLEVRFVMQNDEKPPAIITNGLKQMMFYFHKDKPECKDPRWCRPYYTESLEEQTRKYFTDMGIEIIEITKLEAKEQIETKKTNAKIPHVDIDSSKIKKLYLNDWEINTIINNEGHPEFDAVDVIKFLIPDADSDIAISAIRDYCSTDGMKKYIVNSHGIVFINEMNLFQLILNIKPHLERIFESWIAKTFRIPVKQKEQPLIVPDELPSDFVFENENGELVTTSLIVAKVFGRQHGHVLRDIKELNCSKEFYLSNFGETFIISKMPTGGERKDPCYEIKKDGFTFLVMGYTGEKAGKFKEDFIKAFNRMREMVISMKKSQQIVLPDFTDPVAAARAWANEREGRGIAENKVKELMPSAEFGKSIMASKKSISIAELAGLASTLHGCDVGRNRLLEWMRQNYYICKKDPERHNDNRPMQTEINNGYLELAYDTINGVLCIVSRVLPLGQKHYLPKIVAFFPKRKNWLNENNDPTLF